MGTFRKFDPYAFLADPESLAALATLAGRQSAGAIERWEHAPDGEVPPAKPAKASEGLVTLATLAPLARVHSQIEYEDAGPTPAKAAKVANTSPSELRSERTDQFEP